MTATTTANSPLRLRLRRAAGAVAVALGLALPLAVPTPAAAESTPTPSPTQTPEHEGVQVALLPDAKGSYISGTPLSATLALRNDATTGLGVGTVHLELGRTALGDRHAVSAWLDGSADTPALSPIGDVRTTAVGAEGTSRTQVVVPAGDVGALAPGVYPLRARFEAPAAAGAPAPAADSRTVLVVAQGAPATVITVVPITAAPKGDLLSAAELTALTAPEGALTAQLDGVAGTPAVLAIDPSIPTAIRVLGTAAPATATAWLARLEALPNERFTLQFGDADATAQAAAGLTAPLTVDDFAPFLGPAGSPPSTPTPTPTATATTTAPAEPSPDAITGARSDILWPRGEVTPAQIATMSHYGEAGSTTIPILPSTAFTAGAEGGAVATRGTVGGSAVLVSDEAVSAALSDVAAQSDANARGSALTAANAMLWFDAPGSTVLAGLSRADSRPAQGLADAVTAFSGGLDGRLDRVLSAPPVELSVATESAEDRAAAVLALQQDADRLAQFATILERPADLTVRERISMMRLLGVGVHTTPEDFAAALNGHRTATQKTMEAVGIQPSNPILISPKVNVPVWVRNDLPYPVRVRLHVVPSDSRIEVPAATDVEALPSSTTPVRLPLESHVANAEITLSMSLTSPTGVAIGPQQTARLTIRAEWETIGLIVFGTLGLLLIGAGIFRTVRRRKAVAKTHAAEGMEGSVGGQQQDDAPPSEAMERSGSASASSASAEPESSREEAHE
ncbi:conserved exported hypothetical protein [Microbacterium sp. 8M]|uniref:DUF6049 family protein n=1 Tax=Microbacterium sp. 8M TaxID=2653153 RepID=UPI0012EFCD44|nr:DUF6049 family protein [Microbacterium sp. 8M]VXB88268.1 conserved exported hypothetical protein [Microbacterium sp. 8M]